MRAVGMPNTARLCLQRGSSANVISKAGPETTPPPTAAGGGVGRFGRIYSFAAFCCSIMNVS
jgi:hypothetical protein